MIDFGDGRTYSSLSHTAETTHARHDQPVTKSERFGDDFDRSWPKREETRPRHEQDRPRHEQDRVLFNASSNRLEPHARGQPTQSQPRLMPRDVPRQERDRALPPHLDAGRSHHHDPSRAFPPHMSHSAAPTGGTHGPSRTAWRTGPSEREPPPHLGEQRERSNDHPARDNSARAPPASRVAPPTPHAPPPAPRPSAPAQPPPVAASAAGGASVGPSGENQAAEMHTAAEKARLRRLAEEAEREAAAERARQKARELAERFGGTPPNPKPKPAPASSTVCPIPPSSVAPPPPPGLSKPPQPPPGFAKPIQPTQPQITLAPRPKESSPQAPLTGLPQLPEQKSTAADRASSWRRAGPLTDSPHALPADHIVARRPSHDQGRISDVPRDPRRGVRDLPPHPLREAPPHTSHSISSQGRDNHEEPPRSPIRSKAPPGLERQNAYGDHIASPHPSKREANFDTMLARIQAAMAQSRPTPDVKGSDDSTSPEDERDKHSMEGAEDVGARKEAPPLAPVSVAASAQASATGPSSGPAPSEPRVPAPTRPRKAPPAPLSHRPLEFFDATQAPIPPSPPPAWRVHTVKLPKVPPQNKGPIPRARLRAAEVRISAPRGWAQTFEPPLELHAPGRILADALLLQPIGRRFAKQIETGPVVSISPRHFVPFQRKPKQRAAEPRMLPGDALSFDKTTRSAPAPAPAPGPTEVSAPQPARKPSKGRVAVPGPQAESIAEDGAKPPAVRFMVSSELDGDSLLDEVNKMSLEHIEADDKGVTEAKQLGEVSFCERARADIRNPAHPLLRLCQRHARIPLRPAIPRLVRGPSRHWPIRSPHPRGMTLSANT
ncbi:hypothetical protein CC85DRAFT_122356 [Cutaneotrichosporon oleaginosum]|uniref:Uncharacterized protein n=1 Tax=Cutaneotrichosporon oleaginosum TaxID=879819 RepID=A0A0J0XK65_9TREE|nr:uncharacterized protein CC85DRAFT_122356 [Cutaneotrichosporon oleaginosum]KLT41462.1 hypothetical protein CC85DRAFT_122356 [Cutaneotrichosporon oleaginosum]TXT12222.1 hypothetical protein COLE_02632 [Cutaneotrichosporon oleaginosum]